MSDIAPGWYKDPVDTATQRYWDGEGWLGAPLPADATPPAGPPPDLPPDPPALPAQPPFPTVPLPATLPVPGAQVGSAPGRSDLGQAPPGTMPPGALPPGMVLPPGYPYPPFPQQLVAAPRPHGLAVAGAWSRVVARIVDISAVLVLTAIANAWLAREWWTKELVPFWHAVEEMQRTGGPVPDGSDVYTLLFAMCAVAAAVWFAYEVPSTANSGQTLGKRMLGIKVVRLESADPLGFGRSLRRWSRLGLPTLLWPCYGAGLVLQGIDCFFLLIDWPLRQALHDKQAATVVVEVPRPGRGPGGTPNQLQNSAPGGHDAHSR